jgi:hypothetical protein
MSAEPMVSSYAFDLFVMGAVLVCLVALLIGVVWEGWRK